MYQIKGHFDVMDFKITDFKYDKEHNKIIFTINKLS
jgi:hypothetical protein